MPSLKNAPPLSGRSVEVDAVVKVRHLALTAHQLIWRDSCPMKAGTFAQASQPLVEECGLLLRYLLLTKRCKILDRLPIVTRLEFAPDSATA